MQHSRALQSAIEAKIASIKAIENDIPAVIIIHDIRDWTVVQMSATAYEHPGDFIWKTFKD